VGSARQREVDADLAVAVVTPFIDEQLAVDPQPRTVVHADEEAIGCGLEIERPRPPGRETVRG